MLPFTREQFVAVFANYNSGVWPAQVLAYMLGLGMVILLFRRSRIGDRIIGGGLALMWVWTGIAYHWFYFSSINRAGFVFGALFVLQGVILLHGAVLRDHLKFGPAAGPTAWLGWALVVYAAVLYPLVGSRVGHRYPEMPMFGITPCPVTVFTFGLLLLTTGPVSRWIVVIPFVWSLIGGSAALLLNVPQDLLLLVSGFIAIPLIVLRDRGSLHGVAGQQSHSTQVLRAPVD
ncbi:DUF6064 family protein [Variovorax humicola]|uniref:DUF6064 family protein n=1 Tax=Variovorax humicola TaxID=1769758 RepID=A0ABU8WCH4_9BURK